jgi:hypothetical protein
MDSLLLAMLLNLNPGISEFAKNFSLDNLSSIASYNSVVNFVEEHAIGVSPVVLRNENEVVYGKVMFFTYDAPHNYLIYIVTTDNLLWDWIQESVYANLKSAREGDLGLKPTVMQSNFFMVEPIRRGDMSYHISISVDEHIDATTTINLFMKISREMKSIE